MFGFDDTGDAQVDLAKLINANGVGNWLDNVLLMLGMALFGTVLAFGLLSAGLGRLPAGTAAVISTVEPVVAVILGAVVLGEAVGPLQVVGMVLIVGAVAVLLRYESRPASAAGDEPLVNPVVLSE